MNMIKYYNKLFEKYATENNKLKHKNLYKIELFKSYFNTNYDYKVVDKNIDNKNRFTVKNTYKEKDIITK